MDIASSIYYGVGFLVGSIAFSIYDYVGRSASWWGRVLSGVVGYFIGVAIASFILSFIPA